MDERILQMHNFAIENVDSFLFFVFFVRFAVYLQPADVFFFVHQYILCRRFRCIYIQYVWCTSGETLQVATVQSGRILCIQLHYAFHYASWVLELSGHILCSRTSRSHRVFQITLCVEGLPDHIMCSRSHRVFHVTLCVQGLLDHIVCSMSHRVL